MIDSQVIPCTATTKVNGYNKFLSNDGLAAERSSRLHRSQPVSRQSFFFDSVCLFALHGHKKLNDNLWDGHEGVATREGVEKKVKNRVEADHGGRMRRFWVGPKKKTMATKFINMQIVLDAVSLGSHWKTKNLPSICQPFGFLILFFYAFGHSGIGK